MYDYESMSMTMSTGRGVGAGAEICLELEPEQEISKMGGSGNPGYNTRYKTDPGSLRETILSLEVSPCLYRECKTKTNP